MCGEKLRIVQGRKLPEALRQWAVAESLYIQSIPRSLYLIGMTAKLTS